MSKETSARERNTCPKCFIDFTFLEQHLPHCHGTGIRPKAAKRGKSERAAAKADTRLVKDVPVGEVKAAIKKLVKPGAVTSAVAAKTTQGAVRDEPLRSKRKGSGGARGGKKVQ